jgi:thiosulfate/3-mercaptopyruvate sulfurtransferase
MTIPSSADIITAADAVALAASGKPIVFLDVRFAPGKKDFRPDYDAAHIPGAHFVDLGTQLQGEGKGIEGQRPLPDSASLQANIERWGISAESVVVVYSKGTHAAAARAWFVLKWAGVPNVRYLDGGLDAWQAAGGSVSDQPASEGGGTFKIAETGHLATLSADEIAAYLDAGTPVFDARETAGYLGDRTPRSGHIPGAIGLPSKSLLDADGRLLDRDSALAVLSEHGVKPGDRIGVYCGGGVAAALSALALKQLDIDAQLFVGSFSAWAADPARPVAQGPSPK